MFSNTRLSPAIDFSSHPVFIRQEEEDLCDSCFAPLTRQTNEWILYCGAYPALCARISVEKEISTRIAMGDRHVVGIKMAHSEERMVKRDIMRKMGDLLAQLEQFREEGLTWSKTPGCVAVDFDGEQMILKAYVCNETDMFHILASGGTTEKANKLIYSIRIMYQDNDALPSFESIELTREKWESTYGVTREQSIAHALFPIRSENIGITETEEPATKKRRIE